MPFFNSYLKSLPLNEVCKKKNAYLPTHSLNFEAGDSKHYFLKEKEHKNIKGFCLKVFGKLHNLMQTT